MMDELLEALGNIHYGNLDVNGVLDERDALSFDSEWNRVYKAVEKMKAEIGYTQEQKQQNSRFREAVFKRVYKLSGHGELAEYISDDFGLIADAQHLGYEDEWLDKLTECYMNHGIPSGTL